MSALLSEYLGESTSFVNDFLPAREQGRIINFGLQLAGLALILPGIFAFFIPKTTLWLFPGIFACIIVYFFALILVKFFQKEEIYSLRRFSSRLGPLAKFVDKFLNFVERLTFRN